MLKMYRGYLPQWSIQGCPAGPNLRARRLTPQCPTQRPARSLSRTPLRFQPKSRIRLGTLHLNCPSLLGPAEEVRESEPSNEAEYSASTSAENGSTSESDAKIADHWRRTSRHAHGGRNRRQPAGSSSSRYLRNRAVSTLRQDFASDVEFADLQISVHRQIILRGKGLVLRLHGRTDVPPLLNIGRFSAEIGFEELLRSTPHVRRITLEGLKITMPPAEARPPHTSRPANHKREPRTIKVVVDEIVADGAELDMLVRDPNKPPDVFYIRHLQLQHAGLGQPMTYQATLTNPVPVGEIASRGQVGPWQREEPCLTPLAGTYTFTHADLASIRGLSGILSSQGQFRGVLDRIDVQGETTTPDFSLGISGHPVPLETQFHAIVDGTTGNTMLNSVHAKLLDSEFVARGGVFRVPGHLYRRVLLDAVSNHAKLEDLLRLQ